MNVEISFIQMLDWQIINAIKTKQTIQGFIHNMAWNKHGIAIQTMIDKKRIR